MSESIVRIKLYLIDVWGTKLERFHIEFRMFIKDNTFVYNVPLNHSIIRDFLLNAHA